MILLILYGRDIKIFACNSNMAVAHEIADHLGTSLCKAEVGTFSDGEIAVSIGESVRESDVFIIQSTCAPVNNNLMELLVMIDALKRASAARITAVMPYFGYARQDRKAKSRDPITAKLIANLISTAGASRVLTMDLHALQIQGFFDIPVDHLLGANILSKYFLGMPDMLENTVVVSPDIGSVSRARNFAHVLKTPMAIVDKRRAKANVCEVMNVIGEVEGKNVILVDDMIDTAGTIVNAAAALKLKGAKSITACATHGVLSGPAIDRLRDSEIEHIVLLDTIPLPPEKQLDKIVMLPVAPAFAGAIKRIYEGKPMSTLFGDSRA